MTKSNIALSQLISRYQDQLVEEINDARTSRDEANGLRIASVLFRNELARLDILTVAPAVPIISDDDGDDGDDVADKPNAYQTLITLVAEASACCDAVDLFNLHGEHMQDAWQFLLAEGHTAFIALVRHVQRHADAIIAILGAAPTYPVQTPPALLQRQALSDWRFAAMCHYAIAAERAAIANVASAPPADLAALPRLGQWRRWRDVFLDRVAEDRGELPDDDQSQR